MPAGYVISRTIFLFNGQFILYSEIMAKRPARRDEYYRFGLASWQGHPATMTAFHRHDEVELDFIEQGEVAYRFGHARTILRTGDFALFWGAVPHQLIAVAPGTTMHWLTIPLADVLDWRLPSAIAQRLLQGKLLSDRDSADGAMFMRWHGDLRADDPQRRLLVLLEAQVRLRRLALSPALGNRAGAAAVLDRAAGKVEKMARFIAEHSTEPLRVAQIARSVKLHPDYAVTLFRKTCGMGLIQYLNLHRAAHAQRLLAITDDSILSIAFACGFGSASRFYAVFTRIFGRTPRACRMALRKEQEEE
jgi:AraC family transcriptional regulator, melibiose operon regulatory protein